MCSGSPVIEAADIVVGSRASALTALQSLTGDFWRHAALVIDSERGLMTAEIGPGGVFSKSVGEFVDRYENVGLLKAVVHRACRDRMTEWALQQLERNERTYSWPSVYAVVGSVLAYCHAPRRMQPSTVRALRAAAGQLVKKMGDRPAICNGFVLEAVEQVCPSCMFLGPWPYRLREPVWRQTGDPLWQARHGDVDGSDSSVEAADRILLTATDFWEATPPGRRFLLKRDGVALCITER